MKNPIILASLLLAAIHFPLMSQEHPHKPAHGGNHHPPAHSANAYMHRSSTEELIQRFESPERDAYQQPDKVLAYLGDLKGKTVMDIGAGSGYFSVRLAAQGADVIAADVSDEFQAHLKKRLEDNGIANVRLRKLPYDSPLLQEGEVDMVLVVNTYHHIEKRTEYFAQVRKGIRPTGELVVIDFFQSEVPVGPPTDHKVSIDEVVTELKAAGFGHFVVEVNLLPYQFVIRAR
ncbi:MAG: methyltransferase type 11 [Bacteroidota bacterium]|jgi:2-polyprenyl-3-methyl-5-hydroxy-6-metoxy-1,4-benzoquinol methylase